MHGNIVVNEASEVSLLPMHEPFALFDNNGTDGGVDTSLLFTKPTKQIVAYDPMTLNAALAEVDQLRRAGFYLGGYVTYEAGYFLVDKRNFAAAQTNDLRLPLLNFFAFERCTQLNNAEVDVLLTSGADDPCAVYDFKLNATPASYADKFAKIQQHILAGDTYQVNYTLRGRFHYTGTLLALFRELRRRQRVEYGAYLNFPEVKVASLAPELFLQKSGGTITVQPMKGTAPRGRDAAEDAAIVAGLRTDAKTLAENVMIVDLIRNDIGRIAQLRSVKADNLFEIQTFATLHQMISTVSGDVDVEIPFGDLMRGLFPCGSITGAPKIRTMEIIAELEPEPRGIYTGAIGYVTPTNDCCFNVPIRTIVSDTPNHATMGVGSGVVFESDAEAEYAECLLKAKFLAGLNDRFTLFETMLFVGGASAARHEAQHLARLLHSAILFGFTFNDAAIRSALKAACQSIVDHGKYRLRLVLNHDGQVDVTLTPLAPDPSTTRWLLLSDARVDSRSVFQAHKTSIRDHYDAAYAEAVAQGAYDILFLNEKGELAEASRHNIFIARDGVLLTPGLDAGLLPGVGRAAILAAQNPPAREATLLLRDLAAADKIYLVNSLRGMVEVQLHLSAIKNCAVGDA
jgi:para-aminobenzoate synthetase/4-amino-4-deoxychorismate lyase